ncbi:MAG: 2-oxo acid dehydrogenase subunit E2 [Gammaproteobacteria bacterium]|nr:2-oxo acid dehydrogenase subunit E2 [Gammaproteobacteria bacterium]
MTTEQVVIPDIGDAKDVEVIEICVSVGDRVVENDALIVIESDKASMEVPAPFEGTVTDISLALGDVVNTGDSIATLDVEAPVSKAEEKTEESKADTSQERAENKPEQPVSDSRPPPAPEVSAISPAREEGASVYAGPAVRKLARELGVDLGRVNGSGANGRIVKDDVKAFVKQSFTQPQTLAAGAGIPPIELPDFSRFGEVEEVPLTRIQARGAENLSRSWLNVVHVTQHDEADINELEEFRSKLNLEAADRDSRLTPVPFIIKACASTLIEFPQFNSSISSDVKSLIQKKFVNIGMAVDTEDGLVVPVIRDADRKGVREIAIEANELAAAAQEKKLKPADIQGATFTVSSLGNIGGTGFTPVVNAPEVAILGVARMTVKPVWMNGEFRPRKVLPLSLSYDHRAINGAEAGRFVQALVSRLVDIRKLVL